jgi:hypothetical protein
MNSGRAKNGADKEAVWMFDAERVWEAVIAIILAAAGGFARLLNIKDSKKLQLSRILSELFISGFAGFMVLLLARSFGLSGDWIGLVCGMAGWIGPRLLDLIAKPAAKSIGVDVEEIKDINKEQ